MPARLPRPFGPKEGHASEGLNATSLTSQECPETFPGRKNKRKERRSTMPNAESGNHTHTTATTKQLRGNISQRIAMTIDKDGRIRVYFLIFIIFYEESLQACASAGSQPAAAAAHAQEAHQHAHNARSPNNKHILLGVAVRITARGFGW